MSPQKGRPLKRDKVKNISLQLRIAEDTAHELKECSEILGISRTEVIERGISNIYSEVRKHI